MTAPFTVATDEAVISLIETAKKRLVVIAPALSQAVANALASRFDDLERLDVRVILDADAEVYRLGFGEHEALEVIRKAASRNLLDLRVQPGVRIGVIISDEDTMVFSPVSKNIEASSETAEQPNAIMLRGVSADSIARAAGAQPGDDGPSGCCDPRHSSSRCRSPGLSLARLRRGSNGRAAERFCSV